MKVIFFYLFILAMYPACAQPTAYTVANAHSHNDYKQAIPFFAAYRAGFGSIEADIFLVHDSLIVAHDSSELKSANTLQTLYLQPLQRMVMEHQGYPFADTTRQLQLLIDIKTDSIAALDRLVKLLQSYPALINNNHVRFVITGNRPPQAAFGAYPSFIWFDGVISKTYDQQALARIVMMSDDLENYTHWKGSEQISAADWKLLQNTVDKVHRLNKPIRFWDAPDCSSAWRQLMRLQVDYINTDHIPELALFLNN